MTRQNALQFLGSRALPQRPRPRRRMLHPMHADDDPQVRELVAALEQMNECLRRLTNLTEALYRRAATGQPLTADEAASARQELDATRAGIEPMDELLMIRRQDLRLI
jgi:hypothetical protein